VPSSQPSDFILSLPKAELHLHLEGTISPQILVELSRRRGAPMELAEAEAMYQYEDFSGFMLAFKAATEVLRTSEDYELVTYEMMRALRAQNVVHAEVYVSAGVVQWRGQEFEPLLEGMEAGRARGQRDFGISLYWILDAVRHFGPEAGHKVVDTAVRLRDRNVVGIGIGGDERRAGPELFREVYAAAAAEGLRLTAHAGETAGPESIWGSLNVLRAERIGHGLNAWKDQELVRHLAAKQVPVEVCITSNLRTGCCETLQHHPVRDYFDAGMLVTLNSDDPAMFGTTLAREYQVAQDAFGFSEDELRTLAANSFRASFLPEERKSEFISQVEARARSA
jgi:adenosine deaminase/aminodeoxyfutalosine deaminase